MKRTLGLLLFFLTGFAFSQEQGVVPGELLIQLDAKTNADVFIRTYQNDQNVNISFFNELSDIAHIYHLKFSDSQQNLEVAIHDLYNYPQVQIVQKNHYVSERETIPTDLLFDQQWYHKNTGTGGGTVDADIDATDAWDITTGGLTTHNDSIVVCIIEGGGVDITHEDLVNNIWRNNAEIPDDGIDNDGNGYIDDYEGWNVLTENDAVGFGSHGTRVAGMVGARGNNEIGVTGVNWNVKLMIVKGQQTSNEASIIAAYSYPLKMRKLYNDSYGTQGAFVVVTNSSWGIDNGDVTEHPLWCAMYDSLGVQGVLSVGATTNNNVNVDETGDMPTNCTSPYFIGVTMSNNVDLRAGSGYGTISVDLAAPGSNVRLPVPGNIYSSTSGTSFASPCVAGAIALAYSAPCPEFINLVKFNPAEAALQMRDFILDGIDTIVALGSEVGTGGRLNVFNSINLMLVGCDEDACIPPFNLRAEDLSDTAALLIWDGFTTDYFVTLQETGESPILLPIVGSTSFLIDTLKPCTEYTLSVQADCGIDGLSEASYAYVFTTDGCCFNPVLSNPTKTENEISIAWPSILYATQYNLRYAPEGTEDWTELIDVTSPIAIGDLEKCAIYNFQIYTLCADSTRGYSTSYPFRTLGCGACTELEYCAVSGANNNLEWIDTIRVNGVVKGTGPNAGWLQSEQIITAFTPGESYFFQVTPGFAESIFTERYSIYIDFDQNGIFDLPGERVVSDFSTSGTLNQMISIPASAAIGITKMRIGMSALSEPVPCPTASFFGEYEDYCVYIGPQASVDENEIILSIYPNPAHTEIRIESSTFVQSIKLFSATGQLLYEDTAYDSSPINVADLSNGIYIIQIMTDEGMATRRFVKQ